MVYVIPGFGNLSSLTVLIRGFSPDAALSVFDLSTRVSAGRAQAGPWVFLDGTTCLLPL